MNPSNPRTGRTGRLAGAALAMALTATLSLAAFGSAWARDRFDGREARGGAFRESRGAERAQRMQQFPGERMAPQREFRRGAERREMAPPPPSPSPNFGPPQQVPQAPQGRPGRLTPDERRALRQQINDAGRDVYRPLRP